MSRRKWARRFDLHSDERNHYVYRAFDKDGALLYVGCTYRPNARMKDHKGWRLGWYKDMTLLRLVGPYDRATARAIEREAIRSENPIHNQVRPARQAVSA